MPFCKNIGRTLYKAMQDVDNKVIEVSDEVILITGKVKALEASPSIQAIEAALGIGAPVHAWIDKAFEIIFKVEAVGKTLAEKFKDLLDAQPTEKAKDMVLYKIAAVATSVGDKRNLQDHIYDQAAVISIAKTKVIE